MFKTSFITWINIAFLREHQSATIKPHPGNHKLENLCRRTFLLSFSVPFFYWISVSDINEAKGEGKKTHLKRSRVLFCAIIIIQLILFSVLLYIHCKSKQFDGTKMFTQQFLKFHQTIQFQKLMPQTVQNPKTPESISTRYIKIQNIINLKHKIHQNQKKRIEIRTQSKIRSPRIHFHKIHQNTEDS